MIMESLMLDIMWVYDLPEPPTRPDTYSRSTASQSSAAKSRCSPPRERDAGRAVSLRSPGAEGGID